MKRFPVLLSGDGDLFVWGCNKRGQLTTSEPFLSAPTPVKRLLLGGEKVIHAWSGWTHIVAQTGETRLHIRTVTYIHTTDSQHKDCHHCYHHLIQTLAECSHGAEEIMDNWAKKQRAVRTQSCCSRSILQQKVETSLQRLKSSMEQHK